MRRPLTVALATAGVLLGASACASGTSATTSGHGRLAPSLVHGTSAPARVAAAAPPAVVPSPSTPPGTASSVPPSPAAHPPANPCAQNTSGKLVKVNLHRQRMYLCTATTLSFTSPVTSGMRGQYTETPTGRFRIQGVTRDTTLTLINGTTYAVKYWIPFDGPLFGFHDSSWQTFPYGSPRYRTDGSHGCVHLPLAAIRHLARWATVGTPVVIR